MDDEQLLKYAAKAFGFYYDEYLINKCRQGINRTGLWNESEKICWNPLENDGDALRLAVKLKITPHIEGNFTDAESLIGFKAEFHLNNPYAATRRAIVRAAAEIGDTK